MSRVQALLKRPVLVFCLLSLWFALEYVALGPYSFMEIHDVADVAIPRYIMIARDLLSGGASYWVPGMTGGADRLANGALYTSVSAFFFILFPHWLAFQVLLLGHLFMSTYFTYRLCRDELGLPQDSSLYAGAAVAAAFGSDILAHQWGLSAFPLLLFITSRMAREGRCSLAKMALLGAAYSLFSSPATTLPFCLAALILWFVFIQPRREPRFWLGLGVFGFAAVLPQTQALWAMSLNARWSQRLASSGGVAAPSPGGLLAALQAGIGHFLEFKVAAALALGGIAVSRSLSGRFRTVCVFFLAATLGMALVGFASAVMRPHLSAFGGFHFERFQLLAPFFAALCGAYGLAAIPERHRLKPALLALAFLAILAGTLRTKAANIRSWYFDGGYISNFESSVLRGALPDSASGPYRVATVVHGLHPAYANAYGWESVDGYTNVYPKAYQRLWSKVLEPAARKRNMSSLIDGYNTPSGNRVYLYLDTVEADPQGLPFGDYYRLNLLSLLNTRFLISRHPLIDENLTPLLSQPAWSSIPRKRRILERLRENFQGKSYLYLYENRTVLPRAFLASKVRRFADAAGLMNALAGSDARELRRTVFVEGDAAPALPEKPAAGGGTVSIARYANDEIDLELRAESPSVLVVSNNFSPYWECEVDGRARKVFPADGVFWGVAVGPGDRKASFRYRPPYRFPPLGAN